MTFHAFYVYAYGLELHHEVFDDEEALLAFVKKAKVDDSPYRNLVVIYGEVLDFEPSVLVDVWRVKGGVPYQ